ncbi:MAG: hypothetical protein N3G76_01590 [Candidatus Micrarchaeota archaeon]|nr:hypothetical protein [Candidatus Micrarchaeota archaeon]
MSSKRIYGKVCGNMIETKRKYGEKEEDAHPKTLKNYNKYLQADNLCKKLGWCESHKYVEKLAESGFRMNYEYEPSISQFGRIVAEHTTSNGEYSDIIRLILFVKKVVVPLQEDFAGKL